MLFKNFILLIIFLVDNIFCIKFFNKISNSNLNSNIKSIFEYREKNCKRHICFGKVQIKIDGKWFLINFGNGNKTRNAVQSICKYLRKDLFYSFAFQCISPSLPFFLSNFI